MILNQLLAGTSIPFKKRCNIRLKAGIFTLLLGIITILLSYIAGSTTNIFEHRDMLYGFYIGTGIGLSAASFLIIVRNARYLKDSGLGHKREIYENDERNRLLSLRCWALAGYAMLLVLYAALIASSFLSIIVFETLMTVLFIYLFLLLLFKFILNQMM